MNPLSEVLNSKRANDNRGIQKALRRLDVHILALSLLDIDNNKREILYRNTTKRVAAMIEKEVETLSINLKNDYIGIEKISISEAQEMVTEMIIKWTQELNEPIVYQKDFPAVNLNTYDDLIKTFANINDYASKYGLMSIEGIENSTDNELFKKGIELILDGYDPLLLDEILENYIKSLMSKYLTELNMISSAIKSIQMALPTDIMIEKLNSLKNQ